MLREKEEEINKNKESEKIENEGEEVEQSRYNLRSKGRKELCIVNLDEENHWEKTVQGEKVGENKKN